MSGAEKDAPEKSVQDFLQRWSRRKLGIAEAEDAAASAPAEPSETGEPQVAQPSTTEATKESPPAFDLASLPPIESIDATTDIRAFLAPGVPVELARAALRRAWTSDPAIRDFVGIAENQWDFTNPDAVPGFGSLELSDDVRAMVSRLFGEVQAEASHEAAGSSDTPIADSSRPASMRTEAPDRRGLLADTTATRAVTVSVNPADDAALQNEPHTEEKPQPAQRKHGAALPK